MNIKKLLITVLIIISIILICSLNVYASTINTDSVNIDNRGMNQFDDIGSTIISTIRVIGMIVSVGALMVIGIRYMMSSVEEKALQKESMIFYCIGAVMLFAIVNIVSAIYEWVSTLP